MSRPSEDQDKVIYEQLERAILNGRTIEESLAISGGYFWISLSEHQTNELKALLRGLLR